MAFKLNAVYDRHRPVISMRQDGAVMRYNAIVTIWTHDGHGGSAWRIRPSHLQCREEMRALMQTPQTDKRGLII
jgi:hypothetical protein